MTQSAPPPNSRSVPQRFAVLGVFLLVVVGASLAYQHFTSVYHLATVQPGVLYRDGARSVAELERAIDQVHPKTVVCLVDDTEVNDPAKPQFKQEFDYLQSHGIHMERIKVRLGGYPTSQDIQRFLAIASDKNNQPVLVHCAQGVRRTAMMVATYQESILGYDKTKAKDEILPFNHSADTINEIRKFIDQYDPVARTVPEALVKSK